MKRRRITLTSTNFILKYAISVLFCSSIIILLLNPNILYTIAYSETSDEFDKGDIAEIFDFCSGIFAGLLFVLSLIAYKNIRLKKILFVAIAFGLFAVRTIVTRLDLFVPEIESSLLELTLAIMGFVALFLFFIAIVRKEKVVTKSTKI